MCLGGRYVIRYTKMDQAIRVALFCNVARGAEIRAPVALFVIGGPQTKRPDPVDHGSMISPSTVPMEKNGTGWNVTIRSSNLASRPCTGPSIPWAVQCRK